jgi:hypothetical protein
MRAHAPSLFLFAGLLCAASALAQSTQVYQWKDAKGVTHYSDSPPPPGAKAQDRRLGNQRALPAVAAEAAPADSPQCTSAKFNLAILSNNKQVRHDSDGDGKPDAVLAESDHANQKALAEAAVKAYCKPAAATADAAR